MWRRIPAVTLAVVSGLVLGFGASVLLHQFGVWTLTVITMYVVPLVVATAAAGTTWVMMRRAGGPGR